MKALPGFDLGDTLRLCQLQESDAGELHALIEANRSHLARWMWWAESQTQARTLGFIRATNRQLAENNGFQVAIAAGEQIIGVAGFHGVDWPNRATTIGYWLSEAQQGQGIMTRAVKRLVDHALGGWRLNRVEIRADVNNSRSRALAQRLGFRAEGTLRQAHRVGGRYNDDVVYSLLAEEWPTAGGSE